MILEESREFFASKANSIKNWKSIDQNELVYLYIDMVDNNDPLVDDCLSAIICRFWHILVNRYTRQSKKIATEEDMLEMYIDSIKYVIDKRAWENEDSSIHGRDDAPNVAINVKFDSLIKNFIVSTTRKKRLNDYNGISLEGIFEEHVSEDSNILLAYDNKDTISDITLNDFIVKYFKNKDYVVSFLMDIICNSNVFNKGCNNEFNISATRKVLRELNEDYCRYFSKRYGISYSNVIDAISYITSMGYTKVSRSTERAMYRMSKDKELINSLGGH